MNYFDEIRKRYPNRPGVYPKSWAKPTKEVILSLEQKYSIKYSEEFIQFQVTECHTTTMGDFAFDDFGWANESLDKSYNLSVIVEDAFHIGVPNSLAPFKIENGDFYCINQEDQVVIWNHNIKNIEAMYKSTSDEVGIYLEYSKDFKIRLSEDFNPAVLKSVMKVLKSL